MRTLSIIAATLIVLTVLTSWKHKVKAPPGTVQVSENLFFDKTEITNLNWKEYLSWIEKHYGKESQEYKAAYPDTMVWVSNDLKITPLKTFYFNHPALEKYPVVGVSYEQATAFCKWRSDRVNEQLYIKSHKIKGKMPAEIKIPQTVKYRLPTKQEWENVASVGFSDRVKKKMAKADKPEINFKYDMKKENSMTTTEVYSYYPNKLGIYNMLGNVCEMTSEKGIAKGGSWMNKESEVTVAKDFKYTKPTAWIGFRCVCNIIE